MADGYARASNKPGVIIAGQNGPGATNLVTGVAQAKAAFSPVIAIAGSYSTKDKMEDAFQGLDQQSLFAPITKKTWTVKNSKIIPKIMSDAFNLAMKPRRGPVCLNLPRNILAASNSYNINTKKPSFANESKKKGSKENIKKAAKLIGSSNCSVIIVGAIIAGLSGNSETVFNTSSVFGFLATSLAAINIFGGFLVTQRMLAMYKKKKRDKK